MVNLTEDMVVARSKGSDLHNIKKLNCWGSELSDVSVVRKLPNVEVLSLSVNQITTLEDFLFCSNLQELYIRKNNIVDINEVVYLQGLTKLRSLWLSDNPCSEFDSYRLTVLKALPNLHKLDNVTVEAEEVKQATVTGHTLPLPNSTIRIQASSYEEQYGGAKKGNSAPSSPIQTPLRKNDVDGYNHSLDDGYEYNEVVYDEDEELPYICRKTYNDKEKVIEHDEVLQSNFNNQTYVNRQKNSISKEKLRKLDKNEHSNFDSQASPNCDCKSYSEIEDDCLSVGSNQNSTPSHHHHHQSGRQQQCRRPSPPRLTSKTEAGYELDSSSTENRPFSHTSSEYMYDLHNENPNNYGSHNFNKNSGERNTPGRKRFVRNQSREQSLVIGDENMKSHGQPVYHHPEGRNYTPQRDEYHKSPYYTSESGAIQDCRCSNYDSRPASTTGSSNHFESTFHRTGQIDSLSRNASNMQKPPGRPYPLRPKTRNGNVLSAALCLIKELDISSLEVVEMAVRCRMEELDD